jgi:hypothetical protein
MPVLRDTGGLGCGLTLQVREEDRVLRSPASLKPESIWEACMIAAAKIVTDMTVTPKVDPSDK